MLQHRYEFNTQLEYWDTEDYFRLLTEHAIRGLMLLGAPHPKVRTPGVARNVRV